VFQNSRPFVHKEETRKIIRQAPLTIVTSLFTDLGRYTSDRLARTAASGGVIVVQEFNDMKGLGLVPDVNCLTWKNAGQLVEVLKEWSKPEKAAGRAVLRERAVELANKHFAWEHAIEGMLAIVRDYRARKCLP
jgi:hypothetical protein